MKMSALPAKKCRSFSVPNLAVVKPDPAVVKPDPAVVKPDPAVVKLGPAAVKPGLVRVVVMQHRSRICAMPCSKSLIKMVTANSMKMSALPVKKCRNFSARNLEADKAAGLAVVKVAQVKDGQVLVNPDKDGRVRAAALAKEVKVDAAASGHLIP